MPLTIDEIHQLLKRAQGRKVALKSHGLPILNYTFGDIMETATGSHVSVSVDDGELVFETQLVDTVIEGETNFEFHYGGKPIEFFYGDKLPERGFELLNTNATYPLRGTRYAAAADFYCSEQTIIQPGENILVPTGVTTYMQEDEELNLFIRSGTPMRLPVILGNGVGKIDADYYGKEIKAQIRNIGNEPITIEVGERICQGAFYKVLRADDDRVADVQRTGGFHSTGVN
jgi:dUTP pyrophosphatase